MSESQKYLFHCLDVMQADPATSENTKIIMFTEYARLVMLECSPSPWIAYDWYKIETRPKKTGRYFVHRKDGKVHWEIWNGSGWAYNNDVITFYQEIKPPHVGVIDRILNLRK